MDLRGAAWPHRAPGGPPCGGAGPCRARPSRGRLTLVQSDYLRWSKRKISPPLRRSLPELSSSGGLGRSGGQNEATSRRGAGASLCTAQRGYLFACTMSGSASLQHLSWLQLCRCALGQSRDARSPFASSTQAPANGTHLADTTTSAEFTRQQGNSARVVSL